MMKRVIKSVFHWAGFTIERRDPLLESIPAENCRSPFLPLVYRGSLCTVTCTFSTKSSACVMT